MAQANLKLTYVGDNEQQESMYAFILTCSEATNLTMEQLLNLTTAILTFANAEVTPEEIVFDLNEEYVS